MADFFNEDRDLRFLLESEKRVLSEREIVRKSALAGLAAGPEAAQEVRKELSEEGVSKTQEGIKKGAQIARQEVIRGDINALLMDQNVPAQEKAEAIKAQIDYLDSIRVPSMLELAQERLAIEATSNDPNSDAVQGSLARHLDEVVAKDLALLNAPGLVNWSRTDAGGQVFDLVAGATLPGFGPNVQDVINYASPGFVGNFNAYVYGIGGAIAEYKEYLAALPAEAREEQVRKLVEGINQNKFFGADNDWVKFDMMNTILDDYEDGTWDIALNNIFQALDVIPLAGSIASDALRGVVKGGIKTADTAFMARAKDALGKLRRTPEEAVTVKAGDTIEDLSIPRGARKAKEPPPGVPKWVKGGDNEAYHAWLAKDLAEEAAVRKAKQALDNAQELKPAKSIASTIEKVAPIEAKAMNEAILTDTTGATAKVAGATPVQVTADNILPKMADDTVRLGPDLNDLNHTASDVRALNYNFAHANATDEELATMQTASDLMMYTIAANTPHVNLNRLQVDHIPGGYVARYHVAASGTHGFKSMDTAQKTAETFKEYDKATSRILVRKYDADEFVPVEQAQKEGWLKPDEGEFLVEIDVVDYISRASALANVPIFKPNSIVGKASAWLDKSTVFQDWIVRAGNVAAEAEAAKVKALVEILRPMTKLKSKEQDKIIAVLDEGDRFIDDKTGRPGKWFTNEELLNRWRDDPKVSDMIAGYQSVVRHQQQVRKMLNESTHRSLEADGYKHVQFNPKKIDVENPDQLGKYISRSEVKPDPGEGKEVKRIFDAVSGKVIDVDELALDALNVETGVNKFMKFRTPSRIGKEYVQFAVLRNGEGLSVKKLPKEVIRDIPGYISRIYDAPYILKMEHKSLLNGNLRDNRLEAVRMYSSKGEALRDADLMNANAPKGVKYVPVPAKELRADMEFANKSSLEYLEYSGQLFTSKRGLEVRGVDDKRRLKSVADSIAAARARAARAGTIDATVDKLIANWELRYGQRFGLNGRMPMRVDDIPRNTQDIRYDPEYNEAVAFQRHIMTIAGVDETMFAQNMRNFMVHWSDYLSVNHTGSAANKLAEWGYRNRHRNPVNVFKGTAFTHFIIFNPVRQLWLQAQQASVYLGLEHGWQYFLKGTGFQDTAILMHGSLYRNGPDWAKHRKQIANSFGRTEDEVDRLTAGYEKTGFSASVDTHMYAMFSNIERPLGSARFHGGEGMWRFFNQVRKVSRTVGFDAGEKFQLMGAFLTSRNKWIKNNPKKAHLWDQPRNFEEIMGQTRAVSFNMNKTGVLQFQKGALGAVFQFLSHATKATQVLIPDVKHIGKFANKSFTNAEKRRIALQQFGLYGMSAFGIHEMFEASVAKLGIEVPPDFMAAINEGLNGTLLNFMFAAADDEQNALNTDLELSSTTAPFSGIGGRSQIVGMGNPVGFMIDALLLSDKSALETLVGPSYTFGTRVGAALEFTASAIGMAHYGDGEPRDAYLVIDEWFRRLAPIYNNFIRMRAMQAYDRNVSSTGNLGVATTDGEALAMGILGATSRRQRQISEGLMELNGLPGNPKEDAIKDELNDAAKSWTNFLKRRLEGTWDPVEVDITSMMEEVRLNAEALERTGILSPDEHRYMFNQVQKYLLEDLTEDNPTTKYANKVMNLFANEFPDIYDDAYWTKVKNWTPFEGKDDLIKIVEEMK